MVGLLFILACSLDYFLDKEIKLSDMKNGAKAGEKCAWCQEDVNEGAHRCKACGATRHFGLNGSSIKLNFALAFIVLGAIACFPLGLFSLISPSMTSLTLLGLAVSLIVAGAIIFGKAKKVVTWRRQ